MAKTYGKEYHRILHELIRRLHIIGRKNTLVEHNTNNNRKGIALIRSYHKNIGKDFLKDPFGYLCLNGFGSK